MAAPWYGHRLGGSFRVSRFAERRGRWPGCKLGATRRLRRLPVLALWRQAWDSRRNRRTILDALDAKIGELRLAGKYPEALRLAERYAAESKARFGEASAEHAAALDSLAGTYFAQSSFEEAEPIYRKGVGDPGKSFGTAS